MDNRVNDFPLDKLGHALYPSCFLYLHALHCFYIDVLRSRIHYMIASVVWCLGTHGMTTFHFIIVINQPGVGVAVDVASLGQMMP
jgi:hypothetical protein